MLEAKRIERSRFGFDCVGCNDISDDDLTPFRIWPADDGDFFDAGVTQQDFFNLAGIDIRSATDDHVLRAVLQREEAIFVKTPDVARMKPAAAEGRLGGFEFCQ